MGLCSPCATKSYFEQRRFSDFGAIFPFTGVPAYNTYPPGYAEDSSLGASAGTKR